MRKLSNRAAVIPLYMNLLVLENMSLMRLISFDF